MSSRALHVGLYVPAWPPGRLANGIVTYAAALQRALQANGHRVSIFASDLGPGAAQQAGVHAVRPHRGVAAGLLDTLRGRPRSVYDVADDIAATVLAVHRHDPLDVFEMEESFGWVGRVQQRLPVPVVVKLHGPAFLSWSDEQRDDPGRAEERVRREGEALRAVPVIVAPSRSTLRDTLTHYGLAPKLARCVPNPVVETEVPLWAPDRVEPGRVLFVGRFDAAKGADLVLQAFALAARVQENLQLDLVGPDRGLVVEGRRYPFEEYAQAFLAPELRKRLHFHGYLAPAEVSRLRCTAACSVIGSRRESQGYIAVESLLQGCPTVGFDVPGVNEVIANGVTGVLAAPFDAAALAEAMMRMLTDGDLARRCGAAGRAAMLDRFAADRIAQEMEQIYRDTIALG